MPARSLSMLVLLARRALLLGFLLALGCNGTQNFDDGEVEVRTRPEMDAGDRTAPGGPSSTEDLAPAMGPQPEPTVDGNGRDPAPANEPAASTETDEPPDTLTTDSDVVDSDGMDTDVLAPETQPETPMTPPVEDAGVLPAPITDPEVTPSVDAAVVAASSCEVAACNDHGTCIEEGRWHVCDCDPQPLPECQLPLFRELGPSRTSQELILVQISGDGTVVVGSHVPYETPTAPKVGVRWTLDEGLTVLEQDPLGPTIAWGPNFDGSRIRGHIEPSDGSDNIQVIWRDGVLGRPTEDDSSGNPNALPTPSIEEVLELLADAEIDVSQWRIEVVNDISDDGKVMFGLGIGPERYSRWLLRLP